jgi:hypothetical protein
MIVSRWIVLRMRNVSDKVVEKIKIRILCSITFFRKSYRLCDNVEKYCRARKDTDGNIIRRMRFAWWITKATDTHSECVILIALSLQQWLRERASILRYTYIVCLVNKSFCMLSWKGRRTAERSGMYRKSIHSWNQFPSPPSSTGPYASLGVRVPTAQDGEQEL